MDADYVILADPFLSISIRGEDEVGRESSINGTLTNLCVRVFVHSIEGEGTSG